jgi:hypothetical protein
MNRYSKKLRYDGFAGTAAITVSVEPADHGSGFTVKRSGSGVTGAWGIGKPGLPPLESRTFTTEGDATEYAKGAVESHISRFGFSERA